MSIYDELAGRSTAALREIDSGSELIVTGLCSSSFLRRYLSRLFADTVSELIDSRFSFSRCDVLTCSKCNTYCSKTFNLQSALDLHVKFYANLNFFMNTSYITTISYAIL